MVEQLKDTNLYEGPKDIFTLHKPTEAFLMIVDNGILFVI